MLALSTTWNAHRHTDGELLLREIQELGFAGVALGQNTKPCLIAGMKRVVAKGRMAAAALENFFPGAVDERRRERCRLTAHNASDRREAIRWTAHAIDYAAEFGARSVLLDLGSTRSRGVTAKLAGLARANRLYSRRYVRRKLAAVLRRSRASRRLLEAARESLDHLLPMARAKGVRLALAVQPDLESIPSEPEIQTLLADYAGSGALAYWHDFGAAQQKANLAFLSHGEWLDSMRPAVAGSYVEDVAWPAQRARLPFSGMVDYRGLVPKLPPGTPLVWRVPPEIPAPEIRQAVLAWNAEFPHLLSIPGSHISSP